MIKISEQQLQDMGMQPVQVIASFNLNGDILPLYVKLSVTTLKIISVKHLQPGSYQNAFEAFLCMVDSFGVSRELKLFYHRNCTQWLVPNNYMKMLNEE